MREFTRIKNTILKALCCTRISANTRCVLDTIIRHTWGYRADRASLSLNVFEEWTMLRKQHILRSLKELSDRGIILVNDSKKPKNKLNQITKDYMVNPSFIDWR
jgi:phage replication O-like protein O